MNKVPSELASKKANSLHLASLAEPRVVGHWCRHHFTVNYQLSRWSSKQQQLEVTVYERNLHHHLLKGLVHYITLHQK